VSSLDYVEYVHNGPNSLSAPGKHAIDQRDPRGDETLADWTDEELRAAVRAYLDMLTLQDRGEPYSKTETRRRLRGGALKERSDPSIEYRMRNISAVLARHGRGTLKGYLAAGNAGKGVAERLWALISEADANPAKSTQTSKRTGASLPTKQPPLVYFNVGWMKHYAGQDPEDPTIGAHGYLQTHDHGAECFNFAERKDGMLRGYRPPGAREKTNINRLGASSKDEKIDGVTVVWLAREPATGRSLVVGWYRNATVYRKARDSGFDFNGERHGYSAEAQANDCRLLAPVARTFRVASSRKPGDGGFGQKPTWYGSPKVDKRVWDYIRSIELGRSFKPPSNPPKNHDPELRRKVERNAVEHAISYYKAVYGNDCPVVSVEKDAKGWDLEVFCSAKPLLVEVKGLFRDALICELTPNEYEKMKSPEHRKRYVVYVVNNALAEPPAAPIPSIFEYVSPGVWRTQDGRELKIAERMSAVLTCK